MYSLSATVTKLPSAESLQSVSVGVEKTEMWPSRSSATGIGLSPKEIGKFESQQAAIVINYLLK